MNHMMNIVPVTPALGAVVHDVSLRDAITDRSLFERLHESWLRHLVLFFPGQLLSNAEQLALGECFGPLHVHPAAPYVDSNPALMKIHADSHAKRNNGDVWHSDVSADEKPPMASILHLQKAPSNGGDTLWANMYCVFESFSEPLQVFLRTLEAYHEADYQGFYGDHAPQRSAPSAVHPVIRTHPETGREALYVNRGFTKRIVGLHEKERRALLSILFAAVEEPRFQCRYQWRENDVAIWDNRCTQHHAIWDYYPETRSGVRVTICGDRPKLFI